MIEEKTGSTYLNAEEDIGIGNTKKVTIESISDDFDWRVTKWDSNQLGTFNIKIGDKIKKWNANQTSGNKLLQVVKNNEKKFAGMSIELIAVATPTGDAIYYKPAFIEQREKNKKKAKK